MIMRGIGDGNGNIMRRKRKRQACIQEERKAGKRRQKIHFNLETMMKRK
jgi:hypothetical protein